MTDITEMLARVAIVSYILISAGLLILLAGHASKCGWVW